jgi:hypothetical protein
MSTLAFAGPVALWAATSLETVPFALAVVFFAWRISNDAERVDRAAVACGIAILLWRIDGFVYVGAVLAPAILLGSRERRQQLLLGYGLPFVAVLATYTAFRWWYFGALLTEPLATKVLYKFQAHGQLVTKEPERAYLVRFLDQYGWIAPVLVTVAALGLGRRDRWTIGLLATTMLLVGYVALVGDWMYGFRFAVAILPFYALLAGSVVAALGRSSPRAGLALAVALVVSALLSALWFTRAYRNEQPFPNWLARPSADPGLYFWHFWDAYQFLRPIAPPGTVTAYNQAGFIPFMLDLDNIDDVGLCSRFVARLPTTDVYYTETGRYSPLTPAPVLTTSEAYILYWRPAAVIAAAGLLRAVNETVEPATILGDRYRRAFLDEKRSTAVYLPNNGRPELLRDRSRFLENVAHVSHLRSARVNGTVTPRDRLLDEFPFLAGSRGGATVDGSRHLAFVFDRADVPIYEIYIGEIRAERPVTATLTLWNAADRKTWETQFEVSRLPRQRKYWRLSAPVAASQFTITLEVPRERATVRMSDVRVQGQPPELRAYLERMLPDLRP